MGAILSSCDSDKTSRQPGVHDIPMPELSGQLGNVVYTRAPSAQNTTSISTTPSVSGNLGLLRTPKRLPELVIGIDFGTTFTGVAYAHSVGIGTVTSSTEMREAANQVSVIKNWPNRGNVFTEKTPTILAYNQTPPLFGSQVKPKDEPQVEHFKLGLQEGISAHYQGARPRVEDNNEHSVRDLPAEHRWTHPLLPHMKPVDYARDYIQAVNRFVRQDVLPNRYGEKFLQNQRVSYVITVPAIWSDKAKQLTQKAAVDAGIDGDSLILITEPEAAALYCATLCEEVDLEPGDNFMICDAGGGTVVRAPLE